jgi:hypothetical protein
MSEMESEDEPTKNKKLSLKEFFRMGEVGNYFFRGKNSKRPSNINIRLMHGINRIAIIIFLLGILYMVLKRFF